MAKMTIDGLKTYSNEYVAAAKQAGAWNGTTDNLLKAVDKIGKQVSLRGNFADKLPELDAEELPLGKTIEEYMISLTLPEKYTGIAGEAGKENEIQLPEVEECSYSYTLGRTKFRTFRPFDNLERAAKTTGKASDMITDILVSLDDSIQLFKFQSKKQLIGNMIDRAVAAGLKKVVAKPVNAETGEAFIQAVKEAREDSEFAHEGGLKKTLIGGAPSLMLYVKKGVMPTLQVQTIAGAFNKDQLDLGVTVKVVDDFGKNANDGVYAVLVDPRGIKLHRGYHALRSKEMIEADGIKFVDHSEYTGFLSTETFIRTFSEN